jgi:hypothetical protein
VPDDTGVKIRAFLAVFVPLRGQNRHPLGVIGQMRVPQETRLSNVFIYVLMDARTLRERAEHYRELALRIHDEEIAKGLREIAERYDALAKGIEDRRMSAAVAILHNVPMSG